VLLAEYRGYGGMPGHPSEQGLYADGRAYMRALGKAGVKPENIVFFGHSLGSGAATQMAREFPARGLMLFAPFLSVPKVAQGRFPLFPAEWLTLDRFENDDKVAGVGAPVFIASGGRDIVIPPSQARRLFALAREPKTFVFIPDAGHNDLFATSAALPASLKWLAALQPRGRGLVARPSY
jgi:fermentation-respiration switch protein FrsA (DUF1100 family)